MCIPVREHSPTNTLLCDTQLLCDIIIMFCTHTLGGLKRKKYWRLIEIVIITIDAKVNRITLVYHISKVCLI